MRQPANVEKIACDLKKDSPVEFDGCCKNEYASAVVLVVRVVVVAVAKALALVVVVANLLIRVLAIITIKGTTIMRDKE